MEVCGIIAEYDPFHFGHLYHLKETKKIAKSTVIIMSGSLTQRGSLPMFNKWTRARAALLCGADLVIELPCVFSCSSAERFAHAAIKILKELNCISYLSFGSESGEINQLINLAKACQKIDNTKKMQDFLKQGYSYPKARQLAIKDKANLLSFPNNTLGVEYIKACLNLNFKVNLHTIKRIGSNHNDITAGKIANSSYLRKNLEKIKNYTPKKTSALFKNPINFKKELLFYSLKLKNLEDFKKLPDVTEGLENRLFKAIKNSTNLEEFLILSKTKRYTLTRLNRIVLFSFFNFNKEKIPKLPRYGRVLGFNKTGQKLLSKAKKTSSILFTSNFKEISKNFPYESNLDAKITDFTALFQKDKNQSGLDYINKPIII